MRRLWILAAFLVAVLVVLAFRPVCVPLSAAEVAAFSSPIEDRPDHDFYVKVFQKRNGQWHQCKTWISRQFFF